MMCYGEYYHIAFWRAMTLMLQIVIYQPYQEKLKTDFTSSSNENPPKVLKLKLIVAKKF